MQNGVRDPDSLRRKLVRMAALELSGIVPAVLVWLLVGVVDVRVYLALHGLRLVLMAVYLHRLLEPVRTWLTRGAAADERELLAADATVQQLPRRLLGPYVLGWFLTTVLAVLAALLGFPHAAPIANTELLTCAMVLVAATVVNPAMHWPDLRHLCDALLVELGPLLAARGVAPPRAAASIARELPRVVQMMILTILVALGAITVQMRSNSLRALTEAELREAVVRMAARHRAGLALEQIANTELSIVTREQLPPALLPARADDVPRSVFDPRSELAIAAVALDDGHYLRATAAPPEQLGLVVALILTIITVVMSLSGWVIRSSTRVLLRPLARLDQATRTMVETGQLRALARLTPTRRDELGSLIANFNDMLDMLDELAAGAQAVAAGDLRVALERPGELHDAFRAMLAQLHDMVERLRATAIEVSSASAEIHASMRQHESAALHHQALVDQLSGTTQSLAAAASEINEVATKVQHDAERSLATADTVVERTTALGSQTGGIRELLDLILEIADRSDLLALNGALEATRAGEAGRGFALVAAEMRRLAERVTGTVADMRARVAAIEAAGTNTVQATALGRSLSEATTTAARNISTLTRKQSEDTEQVSGAAQAMATFVISSATTTSQTRAATEGLRHQVEALERLTREFKLRGE